MVSARNLLVPFILAAGALADFQSIAASFENNLLAISTPERGLQSRQSVSSPGDFSDAPECKAPCTSVATTSNNCKQDAKCLCTDSISDGLASCFNCAATRQPNVTSAAQDFMNAYVDACKAKDLTVKSQTIHSNGALSAVTRTGTGVAASLVVIGLGFLL